MARVPQLLGPDGLPIDRRLLKGEQATPTLAGVRPVVGAYPVDGLSPERLASILREADAGEARRYLDLAEQIEELDLHYAGVLATRKRSVAQLEISIDPAGEDAASIEHADMVRAWLQRDELQDELFDILDAVGKGFSVTEIVWDSSEGQWQPARLEARPQSWFDFKREDGRTLMLRDQGGLVPLAPYKFIVPTMRAKSGLPIRSGIARLACWAVMLKAFTQRDWSIFVQTYGQPVRLGRYGPEASTRDRDVLWQAVANIAQDCAAIIPKSMEIEFVRAEAASENSKLYSDRADWIDRQMSKAVIGQTATTDAIAGGHAVGQEHRQVQEDIERADARVISAVLNRDLVRPWVDLEYGPQQTYPRLRVGRVETVDVPKVVDAVTKLVPLGLKVEAAQMYDLIGITEPAEGAELLAPRAPPPGLEPAPGGDAPPAPALESRHAAQAPAAPKRLLDPMRARGAPEVAAWMAAVRQAVEDATDWDDLERRLIALEPDMSIERLGELLAQATAIADLAGRADVLDGR